MLIVCSKCGNKISDKASKCPKCGNLISTTSYSDFSKIESNNNKQMPIWGKILLGILYLIFILIGLGLWSTS